MPGPGRAVQEDAARDARAEPLEALPVTQELDDLVQLLLRLVQARDVRPRDLDLRPLDDRRRLRARHEADRVQQQADDDREEDDRKPREQRVLEVRSPQRRIGRRRAASSGTCCTFSARSVTHTRAFPRYAVGGWWFGVAPLNCARFSSLALVTRELPLPPHVDLEPSRRGLARRLRGALRRRERVGGRACSRARSARRDPRLSPRSWTRRTRSARPASSSSSPAAREQARSTTAGACARSSTGTCTRSPRSSPRSTRTRRSRSSTRPSSSTPTAPTRARTRSSPPRTWRRGSGASTTPPPRLLGLDRADEHLRAYVDALAAGGKYDLTIWPFHALLGGIGHALVSAVEEALFFHAIARHVADALRDQGAPPADRALLGPRARGRSAAPAASSLGARNTALVEHLARLRRRARRGPGEEPLRRLDGPGSPRPTCPRSPRALYLLEDCSSPVVVPGAVDYTEDADAAFARFAEAGAHVVRSTEPIATWPGVIAAAAVS